jgi:hypothetical protein
VACGRQVAWVGSSYLFTAIQLYRIKVTPANTRFSCNCLAPKKFVIAVYLSAGMKQVESNNSCVISMIRVRSPTGAEDFPSSLCVQTGSGVHPASYPMATGGHFPGGEARPGRDADHSPPSSAEVKNE